MEPSKNSVRVLKDLFVDSLERKSLMVQQGLQAF